MATLAACAVYGVWSTGRTAGGALVVYCAHDAVYAEAILRDFERETGLPVEVRYDTEATKSLGLTQLIERERSRPQCDVFWNNELLGTLALAERGLLEPYQGPGWERMPERYRAADGTWVGFGARLRVWIVNTRELTAEEEMVTNLLDLEPTRIAMAMPMFGTTLTHYCVLAETLGLEGLQTLRARWRSSGVREVPGNGLVKDLVAAGSCDAGWTDTDDTFLALEAGAPVAMLPIRVAGRPIVIPNSVAIVRGTTRLEAARKLVDYLTSAETELKLARSSARQIPLGPVAVDQLPDEVRPLLEWATDAHDLRGLLPQRQAVLAWLRRDAAP